MLFSFSSSLLRYSRRRSQAPHPPLVFQTRSHLDAQTPQPPSLETLLSDILFSNPLSFTRELPAPVSLKHRIADRGPYLSALDSVRRCGALPSASSVGPSASPASTAPRMPSSPSTRSSPRVASCNAAYSVAHRALRVSLLNDLIDGYAVTARLLDLLLWMYTKCSMVDRALSTVYKTIVHG